MIAKPKPSGAEGHILRNPVDPKSYFAMLCYKVSRSGFPNHILVSDPFLGGARTDLWRARLCVTLRWASPGTILTRFATQRPS
jgi:hypothetical protein